ncbi:MAG: DUF167 domain-containing protein [Planctomycetota bacterium]|jgi:uncharacterized protein (TIGR00251 family)
MANPGIQEVDGGVVFTAKIVPGSSGPTRFCGLLDGMVKVKVSAAPEKGKANKCLLKFLAKQLDIKRSSISIISGQTSPIKHVQVLDISADTLMEKLGFNKQDFFEAKP